MTGLTYSRPDVRPRLWSSVIGAPSNGPPTFPWLPRNSSMIFVFQSLAVAIAGLLSSGGPLRRQQPTAAGASSEPPTDPPPVVVVRRAEPFVQEALLRQDRAPEHEQHRHREQHQRPERGRQ